MAAIFEINRRDFLKITTLATAGVAVGLQERSLPYVLAGNGNFGSLIQKEITALGSQCLGIVTGRKVTEKPVPGSMPLFADLPAALRQTDAKAVVIATPDDSHFELSETALRNDKHVLLASPFGCATGDWSKLQEAARRSTGKVQSLSAGRMLPDLVYLAKTIREGGIGKLETVRIRVEASLEKSGWQTHGARTFGLLGRFGEPVLDHVLDALGPKARLKSVISGGTLAPYIGRGSVPTIQAVQWKFDDVKVEWESEVTTSAMAQPLVEITYSGSAGTVYVNWMGGWSVVPRDGSAVISRPSPKDGWERRAVRLAWKDLCQAASVWESPRASLDRIAPAIEAARAGMASFHSGITLRDSADSIAVQAEEFLMQFA